MGAVSAVWRPRNGEATQDALVYFEFSDTDSPMTIGVVSRSISIRYSAMSLVGMDKGETVEVDGVSYVVRNAYAIADGADRQANLGKVDSPEIN